MFLLQISLLILPLSFPFLLSFLVPVIALRKAHATSDSEKSLYERLAIYALAPSLLTFLLIYFYANVYNDDILGTQSLMILFSLLYVVYLFSIWIFLPKTNMHIVWKIICWTLRFIPIFIHVIISTIIFVMLVLPGSS